MLGRAYGGGAAASAAVGIGALKVARKQDGTEAVFASLSDLEGYYKNRPKPPPNEAAVTGSIGKDGVALSIHNAYQWDGTQWGSVVSNFKGDQGVAGKPGRAGAGIEPSLLHDGEIPRWDASKQELVSSGLTSSRDGELKVSPDSILFGNHEMAAAVENVAFRNLETHRVYVPLWQEMAPGQTQGYVRQYSGTIEQVVRVPDGSIDVTNPVNSGVRIDTNELFLGGSFTLSRAVKGLMLVILDATDKTMVWRQRLGDHKAGQITVTFEIPFDARTGYQYDILLKAEDGSDVVAKSNASTGFSWTASRVKWVDTPLADIDWVTKKIANVAGGGRADPTSAITHVSLDGNLLTFTHGDGAKHVITLPNAGVPDLSGIRGEMNMILQQLTQKGNDIQELKNQYNQIDHKIDALSGAYSYDGNLLPDYPDDPKHSYFVHLHGTAARDIYLDLPNPANGSTLDGTMFVLGNANSQAKVTLKPNSAETIEGKKSFDLPANHYAVLVKSGSNWIKIIDSSLVATQVPLSLTAEMVSNAIDHGQYDGSGSLKSLNPGWWLIPASNTGVTGRPAGTVGDLIYFSQSLSPTAGATKWVGLAFGGTSAGTAAMWVQYKVGGSWTPWLEVTNASGSADLSAITAQIDELKRGDATMLASLSQLQTAAGQLFAPTQALFDVESQKLIDAAVGPIKGQLTSLEAKVADLEKKIGNPGGGGGGDHPQRVLPQIWVMFSTAVPTALTEAVSSTTGEVTVKRASGSPSRMWVIVEKDVAAKVRTIQVGSSLASLWDTRAITIGGTQYTGFYSAGAFTLVDETVRVNFG